MKLLFRVLPLLSLPLTLSLSTKGQEPLVKDLDGDGINDKVYLDPARSVLVCELSTQNFRKVESYPVDYFSENARLEPTRNGFEFRNNFMRAGYGAQFRYSSFLEQMQLIGMSRYEFGNAANDGSGESSVNLLTNNYIGNWNYYDPNANGGEGELKKIPSIKVKMLFPTVKFESFGDEIVYDYMERCAELYEKNKARMLKGK